MRRSSTVPPPLLRLLSCQLLLLLLLEPARAATSCPGYGASNETATQWGFAASIPEQHLKDIVPPDQFSARLQDVVDGVQLAVTTVNTSVSMGGYGEMLVVPLSTPTGASLRDGQQYPWAGQAQLIMGNLSSFFGGFEESVPAKLIGPYFNLQAFPYPDVPFLATSFASVMIPKPTSEALQVAQEHNDFAMGTYHWLSDSNMYDTIQDMLCTSSSQQLAISNSEVMPEDLPPLAGNLSLADLVSLYPALAPLFPDAQQSKQALPAADPVYVRSQYWPVEVEGRLVGYLFNVNEFASQEDALEGRDAVKGSMRFYLPTAAYVGPWYEPLDEPTLALHAEDMQALMTRLQQDL